MTTEESLQNKIDNINSILLSSVESKSIFDDYFKDSVIYIKRNNDNPPKYKGRSISCHVYYSYVSFDITKKFTIRNFNNVRSEVTRVIFLDALGNLCILNKLITDGYNNPDNIYNRIFNSFAAKKDIYNTKEFMKTLKEHDVDIKIFFMNAFVKHVTGCHNKGVHLTVRLGTEFKEK